MSLTSLSSLSSEEEGPTRRQQNVYIDAFNKYDEVEFRDRFRLTKASVLNLLDKIGPSLARSTRRSNSIEPVDQILMTLRFYATGSFQSVIGDLFHTTQPTIHRVIHSVTSKIANLRGQYIKMPETRREMLETAQGFYEIAHFPRVIGAVDCTHIKIHSPGGDQAESFRNRKGFFSLNVQMVCDAKLKILNVIARWPGSVHDSTIFNDSPLCALFEQGCFENMVLLGDSGYPCRHYLLTPLLNPNGPAQEAYNRAQISSRNPIERLYGVLKRRFPCLQTGLRLKVDNVPAVIVACAVLHNMALLENVDEGFFDSEVDMEQYSQQQHQEHNVGTENFTVRNNIIQFYFT